MDATADTKSLPKALSLLSSERPRNVGWFQAGALLFGDWGTSRLYVLGLAFLVAGRSSFWLIGAMSLLILAVGWAYTHVCRLYPDGGGVYTAGKRRARILGVVGALLLFADYTITASLSAVEAFHYFGLDAKPAQIDAAGGHPDPGDYIKIPEATGGHEQSSLWRWNSPGLWAMAAIVALGAFNLLGPKHSAVFAVFAAVGMIVITLLIVGFALPRVDWGNIHWGRAFAGHHPADLWHGFVYIVLALSGVEAIANLTGVMRKPVFATSRKAIYLVAVEVAVFNLLLAVVMVALAPAREAHTEDMLAYLAKAYIGPWGEWPVRILGGLLLLSATNTAVNGLMSIMYVMSRDGELPPVLQKLNGFGSPWVAAAVAAAVPAGVLLFFHDLTTLASLYAIGVVGAVALDCILAALHPRLRSYFRKGPIFLLGLFLVVVWVTLAFTKWHATAFVAIVMTLGLSLRWLTKYHARTHPKPSLLRQAVMEQLGGDALGRPKLLLATAGSDALAGPALAYAKEKGATLVVSFVREVSLNYKVTAENTMSLESDAAAQAMFVDFLEHGHKAGVPIIPAYDTSENAPEQVAELAALWGVDKVLLGSSRRGAIHQFIKGNFQKRLEALLPPDMPVKVLQFDSGPSFAPSGAPDETPKATA